MAEYDEAEVTDTVEMDVNFAELSIISDGCICTISEDSKIIKLQGLGKELKGLLQTYKFVAGLKQICHVTPSSYMPVKVRKYIHLFISLILEDDNCDREILLEVFAFSKTKLPHIPTKYRQRFWYYFSPWEEILSKIGYSLKTPYLYQNGEFNESCEFIKKLRGLAYVYSFKLAIGSLNIDVFGTSSEETFLADIGSFPEFSGKVRYTMAVISDGSDSKSGDKMESSLVDIPLLPFDLMCIHGNQADYGVGRGTIGAYLCVEFTHNGTLHGDAEDVSDDVATPTVVDVKSSGIADAVVDCAKSSTEAKSGVEVTGVSSGRGSAIVTAQPQQEVVSSGGSLSTASGGRGGGAGSVPCSVSLLLTNAHVVFGGLYNCFDDDHPPDVRRKLPVFNTFFKYGTYLRAEQHIDYTFIRPKRSCFVSMNHNDITYKGNSYRFPKEPQNVLLAWKSDLRLICGENVLKRGMSTGVTIGMINRFECDKFVFEISNNVDGTPFSAPGDSGSLVYLVQGLQLIPFIIIIKSIPGRVEE
jgi:hypothetical protein